MGIDYQLHRVSVDMAKGFREFQKADAELDKGNIDSTVRHLNHGLNLFTTAADHAAKADHEAYNKAGDEIAKGDSELQKSIDAYGDGNTDSAANHYADALDSYDKALDLIS